MKQKRVIKASIIFYFSFFILHSLAAEPKVGCTIALANYHGWYQSDSSFKERPIAEEMAKHGIDLCWYMGWEGAVAAKPITGSSVDKGLESLKQFNAVWLITEHEHMCKVPAAETAAALKAYVEAGGGLVFCFSTGRYPEAPVDAYWTEVMKTFGAEILHEEIFNPETEVKVDKCRNMFYTAELVKHPVTADVPGLWLADRSGGTWGSAAVRYSPEWTVVVTGGKGAKSVPKNRRTNEVEFGKPGFYAHDAPIVAARGFGKGRVVFIASHKDTCGWMFGVDKWPGYPERSNYRGKPSDMVTLVENALKWASEPSLGDKSFTKNYRPLVQEVPPYRRSFDFGRRWEEKGSWPKDFAPGTAGNLAKGVVGVHSSYSDGSSTVAEYVAAAKAAGLNFLVFTDPLDKLGSAEQLAKLRADCAANSTDDFYCCPGVEYVDSSDCEWALWHDKVEFPDEKPFLRDNRYYKLFDGRKILQRNQYGGHQNLYRGVLLNMKRVEDVGNDLINLAYFNAITPRVYDEGKLLHDNYPFYLKTGHNLHRAATVSFTRVRSAADLAKAAATGTTVGRSLKAVRAWANAKGGWGGQEAGANANLQAVYAAPIEIADFRLTPAHGSFVERAAFRVKSPAGVKEVVIRDGNRRVLARFDAKGEKDFARVFDFVHDRQMVLILSARGVDGGEVVSNSRWLMFYHAGMMRCGDNSNLLSQNPAMIVFLNWDDALPPPFKKITRDERNISAVSEATVWEGCHTMRSRYPSAACWGEYSRIYLQETDYPSEKAGLPSSHTFVALNQPNVVSIFDTDLGEFVMEPTRSETSATYALCSPVKKISDGRFWRRRHRVYQFIDRHDGWWRAIYKKVAPDYRGGYAIVEGEIEFTEASTLKAPINLVRIDAAHPAKQPEVFARDAERFTAGSYHALCADPGAWYGFFGLAGGDPLHVHCGKNGNGLRSVLQLGKAGDAFKPGDRLRYRFAVASFVEAPHGGQYCEWFARMMNGEGFNHVARKGEVTAVNGIVEVKAAKCEAEVELGSTWFIQDYPVRVKGLVDNGSAVAWDGGRIMKPLAFAAAGPLAAGPLAAGPLAAGPLAAGPLAAGPLAKTGEAYTEIPLEERKTWRFMNLYVANDPALRFTVVPALPGHEKETVEIHNPTENEVTAEVRNVRTGERFEVAVPAGSTVVK